MNAYCYPPLTAEERLDYTLQNCCAVVRARVCMVLPLSPPGEPWHVNYVLLQVRRVYVGQVAELGPTRMLWMLVHANWMNNFQLGGDYVLVLDKLDNVYEGPIYQWVRHWRVKPFGRVTLTESSLEALKNEGIEELPPHHTSLPALVRFLRRYQKDPAYYGFTDAAGRRAYREGNDVQHSYVSGYSLKETAAFCRLVVLGRVTALDTRNAHVNNYETATVRVQTTLKGATTEAELEVRVRPGQVQEGEKYIFLLTSRQGAEPHRWLIAAKHNAVIPITDTRKVRRVYRALGLEMPEE